MMRQTQWTTADFERMSWHDVHVHGFRFAEEQEALGSIDLVLDIDYILQWHLIDDAYVFDVAPATLRFHAVFGLKILLDYAVPSAGMCPFSIDAIRREEVAYSDGSISYRWSIDVNWPDGRLEFLSPGFTQTLDAEPQRRSTQMLAYAERRRPGDFPQSV